MGLQFRFGTAWWLSTQIAQAVGEPGVTTEEIDQLSRHEPRLDNPKESDRVIDPSFGRRILLRRYEGESRVTIFDGAHDVTPGAALAWFDARYSRNR